MADASKRAYTIHYLIPMVNRGWIKADCVCGEHLVTRTGPSEESPDSLYQTGRLQYLEHARKILTYHPGHTLVVPAATWTEYMDSMQSKRERIEKLQTASKEKS